MTDN